MKKIENKDREIIRMLLMIL